METLNFFSFSNNWIDHIFDFYNKNVARIHLDLNKPLSAHTEYSEKSNKKHSNVNISFTPIQIGSKIYPDCNSM